MVVFDILLECGRFPGCKTYTMVFTLSFLSNFVPLSLLTELLFARYAGTQPTLDI